MALSAGIIFGILAMFAWGFTDFFAKLVVSRFNVYKSFFYSFFLGTSLVVLIFLIYPLGLKFSFSILFIGIIIGFSNLLGQLSFYKGMAMEKLSVMSPLAASFPIITIFLSISILGESLLLNQWLGVIVSISGLFLVSIDIKTFKLRNNRGIVLGLFAMLSWGVTVFATGLLVIRTNWLYAAVVFRVITMIFAFLYFKIRKFDLSIGKVDNKILLILSLIGISEIAGTLFFNLGVTSEAISLVTPIAALYPAIALILGIIFLKERLLKIQKIGIIGILAGLVLISV